MKQSDQHSVGINRHHIQSAGGGECSSQINTLEVSKQIMYNLQERECRSQIDIVEISNEITYILKEGKNAALRSTFCRHQKRDYIQSAGG